MPGARRADARITRRWLTNDPGFDPSPAYSPWTDGGALYGSRCASIPAPSRAPASAVALLLVAALVVGCSSTVSGSASPGVPRFRVRHRRPDRRRRRPSRGSRCRRRCRPRRPRRLPPRHRRRRAIRSPTAARREPSATRASAIPTTRWPATAGTRSTPTTSICPTTRPTNALQSTAQIKGTVTADGRPVPVQPGSAADHDGHRGDGQRRARDLRAGRRRTRHHPGDPAAGRE